MPDTIELGSASFDTPRSPQNISTGSSQRGFIQPIHPEKSSYPTSPLSPRGRLTRKRAASLNTETPDLPPAISGLALNSANSSGPSTSDLARGQVCLCQPDPKIPRPRNAFILYRQHYQAQVIAQHPGLANPEISKIIGEQWREQLPEVKNDWKKLAEEEKQRHQLQYPGYRYQPRRAGKPNGALSNSGSLSEPSLRCPKCGGRYISTPSTPLTPFTPAFGPRVQEHSPLPATTPTTISRSAPLEKTRYSSQFQTPKMDSPRTAPHPQNFRRTPYPRPPALQTHREQEEDMDLLITSPDQKRRRFNNDSYSHRSTYATPSSPLFPAPQAFSRSGGPTSATTYRQQQLPGPGIITRQPNMGPPSQPSPMQQPPRNAYPNRSNTFDESLRLPPLQTQILNTTSSSSHRPDTHIDSQARSVEAMVMNIPYVNKIKLLGKISPPLRVPGPTSPAPQTRGAVVAIEGADRALVAEVGDFITKYLLKEPSCIVQTWNISDKLSLGAPTKIEIADARTLPSSPAPLDDRAGQEPFIDYLTIISEWHRKSCEIAKFITTTPLPPHHASITSSSIESKPKALPVALMPRGFSLTISDEFACRIPIKDSYAPVDHWQWMATLWRGIIGPDLTVYTKRVDRDELDRLGGVEMRSDCKGIIVRVLETDKMEEKTARRLGFEVMEAVRGVESVYETR